MKLKHILFLYGAYAVGIYAVQYATGKGFVPTNIALDPLGSILHYPNGLS